MKKLAFSILMALLMAQWAASPQQDSGSTDDAIKEVKRLGIVTTEPKSGRFVKVESGYMVPYKTKIPGTSVEFEMVPIPGGTFLMGSAAEDDDGRADEKPQVKVTVKPLWIGKHEVTWAEYKLYMQLDSVFKEFQQKGIRKVEEVTGVDAITAPSSLYDPTFTYEAGDEPDQPAATMSQFAAKQYTKWLSLLLDDFYRLPTEAEWEYACRAGTITRFYFGDDADDLESHAWFEENSEEMRHEVGQLKPNPWGLYDMLGNVAEWVLDQYDEESFGKMSADKAVSADAAWVRAKKVFPRVLKGGSWELEAEDCRCASRLASSDEEWRDEDPNYPQSPWWYTTSPGLGTGMRIIRPLELPDSQAAKDQYWDADHPRIIKDAKNRIEANGRGAFGIVDPELPAAIQSLRDDDR